MFGYVRAFKPQMKICEYDTYKSVYCGLCKKMGEEFGFVSRMTLSYDFTFLTLMNMALGDFEVCYKSERCIAHPFKKSTCLKASEALEYPSCAAVILIYHKLKDDYADKGFKGKAVAFLTLPFLKQGYRKACGKYPELAEKIESLMNEQKTVEEKAGVSLDEACEASSQMMAEIASYISADEKVKPELRRFGYFLGRYVYLCDALDDLKKDCLKGNFNPLRSRLGIADNKKELSDEEFQTARDYVLDSVNLTMAELAESYVKLPHKHFKPINDNIVYLGMKNTFSLVYNEKFNKKEKKERTQL